MGNTAATVSTVVETSGLTGGMAVDQRTGDRYYSDSNCIKVISLDGVVRSLAGTGKEGFKDGPADQAQFYHPYGVALDPRNGNLYVCDQANHRIRLVSPDGDVSTVVGTSKSGFMDGPLDEALLSLPVGIAVDPRNGDIYFTDFTYQRIRLISNGVVSTVAGTGLQGSNDGPVDQARLNNPHSVAVDPRNGDIYFSDQGSHRLRVVSGGVISAVAGNGNRTFADGPADQAQLNRPSGIALDPRNGDLYFSDYSNNRVRVLSRGVVSTVAGSGKSGLNDGPGEQACFSGPTRLALDPDGAVLYVVDYENKRLRAIALSGPLNLSVSSCLSLISSSPRYLLCRNCRGLTPVEMARLCGESEEVVKVLEERTGVAIITDEVHPGASEEVFKFWYDFWDEL